MQFFWESVMKAFVLSVAIAAGLAFGPVASAKTVFVATPLGLIAVHSPRPVRPVVVVHERPAPVCVRYYKHWRCR